MTEITGKDLTAWGFKPGRQFKDMIAAANAWRGEGWSDDAIAVELQRYVPIEIEMRTNSRPFAVFLDAENDMELANKYAVYEHMDALMRVPTIEKAAVMPDACPSGHQPGTIPVGGVVATKNAIHPGFHSADICCSMALTTFKRPGDARALLDIVQGATHFGYGKRADVIEPPADLMRRISDNPFLKGLEDYARFGFATQGDGNHFAFVGHRKSSGKLTLVTHHGSRGLGAQLYKRGMAVAQKHTKIHAPRVPHHNAWIEADSQAGQDYWAALQLVREWTRESHYAIHDLVQRRAGNAIEDRFWNEHNFVFQRADGLFYHAKGATPSYKGFSADDDGRTLIPMNMAEPILITEHTDSAAALGFAPHGAGRNMSRSQFARETAGETPAELTARMAPGIDARAYCGTQDISELPGAYKNAAAVRDQIDLYALARVVDEVRPYGCIMAGDVDVNAPWRKKREAKKTAREALGENVV